MNIKDIKVLISLLDEAKLHSLSYKNKDFEITLVKNDLNPFVPNLDINKTHETEVPVRETPGIFVRSPLVGTFYSKKTPDVLPYVKVGDKIKQGDVLCLIEAMKVMNEITSDVDGEVVEVYVENGEAVEYDQPLFRIV